MEFLTDTSSLFRFFVFVSLFDRYDVFLLYHFLEGWDSNIRMDGRGESGGRSFTKESPQRLEWRPRLGWVDGSRLWDFTEVHDRGESWR